MSRAPPELHLASRRTSRVFPFVAADRTALCLVGSTGLVVFLYRVGLDAPKDDAGRSGRRRRARTNKTSSAKPAGASKAKEKTATQRGRGDAQPAVVARSRVPGRIASVKEKHHDQTRDRRVPKEAACLA